MILILWFVLFIYLSIFIFILIKIQQQGTLVSVDSFMNTEMSDAHLWSFYAQINEQLSNNHGDEPIDIQTEPDLEFLLAQPHIDYIFIKGSRIRYFHLPSDIDVMKSMQTKIASFSRRNAQIVRPFNWKSFRKRQKLEQTNQNQKTLLKP